MKSQITFVTGGTKSGKSAFAEGLLSRDAPICYIATGVMISQDPEMQLRIKTHQQRRSQLWQTEERYKDFSSFVLTHQYAGYLLDDAIMGVTNLFYELIKRDSKKKSQSIDNFIDRITKEYLESIKKIIINEWRKLFKAISTCHCRLVIVSDEVGLGIVPATKQSRILRDIYGEVNQLIAQAADDAYFVISGLPQRIK